MTSLGGLSEIPCYWCVMMLLLFDGDDDDDEFDDEFPF